MLPVLCGAVFRLALPRGALPDFWGGATADSTVQMSSTVVQRGVLAVGFVYHCALLCASCMEWSLSRSQDLEQRLRLRVVSARSWLLLVHVCVHAYSRGQLAASLTCGGPQVCRVLPDQCCEVRGPMLAVSYSLAFLWLGLGPFETSEELKDPRGLQCAAVAACSAAGFWLLAWAVLPACDGGVLQPPGISEVLVLDTVGVAALAVGLQALFTLERRGATLQLACGGAEAGPAGGEIQSVVH